MGTDLFSACIFCASLLLRPDTAPIPGWSGELAGAYATLERRNAASGALRDDISDVTPKFVGAGFGRARLPEADLGAGTPAGEWRLRLAIADSHDEGDQGEGVSDRITIKGTGRYENFAGLWRIPVGSRGSLEFAVENRAQKVTDLVNIGGSNFQFSEERDLIAQRGDLAVGYRRRWKNLELAGILRGNRVEGRNVSANSLHGVLGILTGGEVEALARRGDWLISLSGEELRGNLPVNEERAPDFTNHKLHSQAFLRAATLTLRRDWPEWELAASLGLDRSRLPFVALAVLGEETRLFDEGLSPVSRTREVVLDLSLRRRIGPQIYGRAFFQAIQGTETVTLTDPAGILPPESIAVRRGGHFPITQFVLGIAADFSLGP